MSLALEQVTTKDAFYKEKKKQQLSFPVETSQNFYHFVVLQVQVSLSADNGARRSIVDHTLQKDCSDESLRIMMDICIRCLSEEQSNRPSVEDVLWNLQFATQVQDLSRHDFQFDQELPVPSSLEL